MSRPIATKPTGRPREFDADEALERALELFWRQGYEGTSLGELTAAMGINRPSLYAAFGNKESLFRKALDRYVGAGMAFLRDALEEPTARRAIETLLRGYVAAKQCFYRAAGGRLFERVAEERHARPDVSVQRFAEERLLVPERCVQARAVDPHRGGELAE